MRRQAGHQALITSIDKPLEQRKLSLAIDDGGGLVGEWGDTCGKECVGVLLNRWEGLGAVNTVPPVRSIGNPVSKKLSTMGFKDTIDRLMIRIALVTSDKTIVSEDPDFWDPNDCRQKGNSNACVASLCQRSLGITVLLLGEMLRRV